MRSSLEILSDAIRAHAAALNITAAEVARRANMTPAQLSKYMTGKTVPSLDILDRIAAALNTSPAKLLDDGTTPESGAPPVTEAAVKAWVKLGEEIGMFPPEMSEKYETALADLRKLAAGQYVPPRPDAPESPDAHKPRARRR